MELPSLHGWRARHAASLLMLLGDTFPVVHVGKRRTEEALSQSHQLRMTLGGVGWAITSLFPGCSAAHVKANVKAIVSTQAPQGCMSRKASSHGSVNRLGGAAQPVMIMLNCSTFNELQSFWLWARLIILFGSTFSQYPKLYHFHRLTHVDLASGTISKQLGKPSQASQRRQPSLVLQLCADPSCARTVHKQLAKMKAQGSSINVVRLPCCPQDCKPHQALTTSQGHFYSDPVLKINRLSLSIPFPLKILETQLTKSPARGKPWPPGWNERWTSELAHWCFAPSPHHVQSPSQLKWVPGEAISRLRPGRSPTPSCQGSDISARSELSVLRENQAARANHPLQPKQGF